MLPIFRHTPYMRRNARTCSILYSRYEQAASGPAADDEIDILILAPRTLTVGEWVRRTLREARKQKSVRDAAAKLAAIRRAVEYNFPTADIDQMLPGLNGPSILIFVDSNIPMYWWG